MEIIPQVDDHEIVARYKATYGLADISVDQAMEHFALERRLTRELLASTAATRHETFERCYNDLYARLPWLTGTGGSTDDTRPARDTERWLPLIGPAPRRVYEIGSGTGQFARELARAGHTVDATDISRHRGSRDETTARLRWSRTDGVNVDRFAPGTPYDVVVSDQVVEHLHPDDLAVHVRSCSAILRPGGLYVVRTPHAVTGPHDMSAIFGFDHPIGMHLREYTVRELRSALLAGGFATVRSVVTVPPMGGRPSTAWASQLHLASQIVVESLLARLPHAPRRRVCRLLRGPLRPDVWLVAATPG